MRVPSFHRYRIKMAPKVERVTDIPILQAGAVGEGPHWDVETQSLYFIDVFGKNIHKYVPSTGQHTSATLGKVPSIIIPVKGKQNQFVVGSGNEIDIVTWDGVSEKVSKIEKIVEMKQTDSRLNDGKIDPKGRLWIGSIGPQLPSGFFGSENGFLYSIEKGKVSTHEAGISCSNGLTWNEELKQFYYIDSGKETKGTVDVFDYDVEKGTIANRRTLFTLTKHLDGGLMVLDGMTIDKDGNLWAAVFGANCILKIDPRKPETLLQKVDIPATETTSVAWGGKDLDVLYVTSGNVEFEGIELTPGEHGAIFKVTGLGTSGLPMRSFEL